MVYGSFQSKYTQMTIFMFYQDSVIRRLFTFNMQYLFNICWFGATVMLMPNLLEKILFYVDIKMNIKCQNKINMRRLEHV